MKDQLCDYPFPRDWDNQHHFNPIPHLEKYVIRHKNPHQLWFADTLLFHWVTQPHITLDEHIARSAVMVNQMCVNLKTLSESYAQHIKKCGPFDKWSDRQKKEWEQDFPKQIKITNTIKDYVLTELAHPCEFLSKHIDQALKNQDLANRLAQNVEQLRETFISKKNSSQSFAHDCLMLLVHDLLAHHPEIATDFLVKPAADLSWDVQEILTDQSHFQNEAVVLAEMLEKMAMSDAAQEEIPTAEPNAILRAMLRDELSWLTTPEMSQKAQNCQAIHQQNELSKILTAQMVKERRARVGLSAVFSGGRTGSTGPQ